MIYGFSTFHLLFEQTPLVMVVLDLDGTIVEVNPATEELSGLPSADLRGQPFTALLDWYSHDKAALMLARVVQDNFLREWELVHLRPRELPVTVAYTASLLHEAGGEKVGIGLVGRVLTPELELTAQLAATNQLLEATVRQGERAHAELKATQTQLVHAEKMRSLGQLVAGVAHEINNPLAFVANNLTYVAELLPVLRALHAAYAPLRLLASPEQEGTIQAAEERAASVSLWQDLAELLEESQDGVTRIKEIVLSLRDFARLDEAPKKVADVHEGLCHTVRLIRSGCRGRIGITEHYCANARIFCHPGELNQVFLNLLINAMQAIKGEGTIHIATERQADKLIVTIRDSGVGMDAATLQRAGEPFFTTKPVGEGTGLGLAVSYGIVRRHGGELRFDSAPGKGTTATVSLPARDPSSRAARDAPILIS
jgi:two-component system, NtrC family, sensor kinase